MLRSLRGRLFAILVVTTGLIWTSAVAWIYWSTQAEVQQVLDRRLSEAARMVSSLVESRDISIDSEGSATRLASLAATNTGDRYDRQLSCQIWSLRGELLGQSEGAPAMTLASHATGFGESLVDGETWRVFAVTNEALGIRVLVGDNVATRDHLVDGVVNGLLLPMAAIVPLLAALLWFAVSRGLSPLTVAAGTIAGRRADDLSPIEVAKAAPEIRPLLAGLNDLLRRVEQARSREKDFTAYAAHELRTPLSGLKTQAQVALASRDEAMREAALGQIVTAVDRTSRLVSQLLDTARLDAGDAVTLTVVAAFDVAARVAEEQRPLAAKRDVSIVLDPGLKICRLHSNSDHLHLALRNLVENAVRHSPTGARVSIKGCERGGTALRVEDEGPGMKAADLQRATERFFRGSERSGGGSGLGLSIAAMAAERAGLALVLANRAGGGLSATLKAGSAETARA